MRGILGVLAALAAATHAVADDGELYRFTPIPGWVKPATPEYHARVPKDGLRHATHYLLSDRQVSVRARGSEEYAHFAMRVTNTAAVERQSQFDIEVEPDFQDLQLHFIRVVRGGKSIDQLPAARLVALPKETRLERRIYDGTYNVNILLEDVRVGDVLEYAYTLRSTTPAFPTHYADSFSFGFSSPVQRHRVRILHPSTRPVRYRTHGGEATPRVTEHGAVRELVFEWKEIEPIASDEDQPSWYSFYPYLELTDHADWGEVARAEAALYPISGSLDPQLTAIVDRIRAAGGTAEEQALHALQFVQDEIRYTSVSIGRGAHEPSDPARVLQRRFGDCKDKSLLLSRMLESLGIHARPALVNTDYGHILPDALPTPFVFDHVIARAKIGDKVYWLDGTRDRETGPLASLESPAHEYALVIDPATQDLERIPPPSPDARRREIDVRIDARAGADQPATLEVTTRYYGASADSMRHDLARRHITQRTKDYLDYYGRHYPGLQPHEPLKLEDDPKANVITIRESYTMERAFTADGEGTPRLYVPADELESYSKNLGSRARTTPIAVTYPVKIRQWNTVLLPREWSLDSDVVEIQNPAFRYRSEIRYADRKFEAIYEYQALADHVPTPLIGRYLKDRQRMYNDLGYTLRNYTAPSPPSWMEVAIAPVPLLALLVALGIGIWAAVRFYQYDPEPAAPRRNEQAPRGIQGLLLLPAFHVAILPLVLIVAIAAPLAYIEADNWQSLGRRTQVFAMVFLALGGAILPVLIMSVILFFNRRTSAPRFYIAGAWTMNVYVFVLGIWMAINDIGGATAIAAAHLFSVQNVIAAVCTIYLVGAARVRATFVERTRRQTSFVPESRSISAA